MEFGNAGLRNLFSNLNEEVTSESSIRNSIRGALKTKLEKLSDPKALKSTKSPRGITDLRMQLKPEAYGNREKNEETIKSILVKSVDDLKRKGLVPQDMKFSKIAAPGDFPNSVSGTFPTFIFTFKVDGKTREFKMVNSLRMGKTVGLKEFTPNKILSKEILDTEYNKPKDFTNDLQNFLEQQEDSPKIQYINYLTELALRHAPDIDLDEIKTFKDITVSGLKDDIDLDPKDKNAILTDFGEIFAGLLMSENDYLVGFPSSSNLSIVDLRVKKAKDKTDVSIGVSVKKDFGARASVTGVIERINDLEKQDPGILRKFKAAKVFHMMGKDYNTVIHIPVLASHLASEVGGEFEEKWNYFKSFVKKYAGKVEIDFDNLTDDDTDKFSETLMRAIENLEKKYHKKGDLLDKINEFQKKMGQKKGAAEYKRLPTRWGYLLYPLRVAVVDQLNKDEVVKSSIKKFLGKLAIKQFHLYKRVDDNGIDVSIVSYGATEFSFNPGGSSSTEPWHQKISFKIHAK